MKKLILIPLFFLCISVFGQFTKPQLYSAINTNIRLKTASQTRIAAMLDSLVASMELVGASSMVYPGAGIPLSTGSAWGTSITDNSTNWNTAFGWGNHASAGYMTLTGTQTNSATNIWSGSNRFISNSLQIRNAADTRSYYFEGGAIAADRFITLPDLASSDFLAVLNHTQTFTNKTISGASNTLSNISSASIATTLASKVLTSPRFETLSTIGYVWTASGTDGSGGWAAPSSGLTVGTSTITSGTNTRVLYNNSGVLGEYTVSGSGNVAMTTSPTFTTPILGTPTSGTLTNTTGYLFNNLAAATGANTINNVANAQEWQWNSLAAGTGLLLSSSSTAAASNTNTLFRVNQTGANATSTQTTYSGYLSNTKTGTSSTNVGFYSEASGGTTNLAVKTGTGSVLIGNALSDVITANTRLDVRGTGTSTELIQRWASSTNNQVLSVTNQGQISLSPSGGVAGLSWSGQVAIGSTSNGTSFTNNGTGILVYGSASTASNNILTVSNNANLTATSGTQSNILANVGFAPTSGTATFNGYRLTSTINQTGGANGQITFVNIAPTLTAAVNATGFDYNPSVTSVSGTHLSFRATSGKVLFGGTTITSNTYYDLRGGSSTDKILRLADGSDNELFTFKANKEYEVTQTNAKYQERQSTGTTAATSFSEIIYSSSDISDGQSVTIEVIWAAKDSGANTGAGGVFYTTWTKASGTLAKAGDNQLVTNDNMTGAWTVSTSDSSGSIQLDFAGVGVANTEISFSTRIIKTN